MTNKKIPIRIILKSNRDSGLKIKKFFLSGFLLVFKGFLQLEQISAVFLFLVLQRGHIIVDTKISPKSQFNHLIMNLN